MNIDNTIENLKTDLVPAFYNSFESVDADNFFAVFKSRDLVISRYFLALSYVQQDVILVDHIKAVRAEIKSKYRAIWCIREIGLHIILFSNHSEINTQFIDVKSDKIGNHAVILQGVHLVDTESNILFDNLSNWGVIKFGKGKKIDAILVGPEEQVTF